MKPNIDKLVVVTSAHGEKFVGELDQVIGFADITDYLKDCKRKNEAIAMTNVYVLAVANTMGPRGELNQAMFLTPPDPLLSGAATGKIWVSLSSWYLPKHYPDTVEKLSLLYQKAEEGETRARLHNSGLHSVSVIPSRDGN